MPRLKGKDGSILIEALEGKTKKMTLWERDFHKNIKEVCNSFPQNWLTQMQSYKLEELYRRYA